MSKICIIIPSRNEPILIDTILQFQASAKHPEDVRIFAILDGWDFEPTPKVTQELADQFKKDIAALHVLAEQDPRITVFNRTEAMGVRAAANTAAALTDATYVMKIDAHCELSQNWDEHLIRQYEEAGLETLIIPQMVSLDGDTRKWGKRIFSHCYLDQNVHQHYWPEYNRPGSEIMSNIGATWFTSTQYWWQIELHDEVLFGSWGESAPETSLKCWLSGGKMLVNTDVTFAHMFRKKHPYAISGGMVMRNKQFTKKYWLENSYQYQIHPFEWLIGKFWPVPGWEKGALSCRK